LFSFYNLFELVYAKNHNKKLIKQLLFAKILIFFWKTAFKTKGFVKKWR